MDNEVTSRVEKPYIEMSGIYKSFPGVMALDNVDFSLEMNEVHALLGENGAGKTTLMRILAGIYRADKGSIRIGDEFPFIDNPAIAIAAGVGMVHQRFRLVEKMTVAENIFMGWNQTPWNISGKILANRCEEIFDKYNFSVEPNAKIWQLSVGEQQHVEILRVLSRGARVLILDEPTAILTPNESSSLIEVLKRLADEGHIVVFISHKLKEVIQVSDRVTILRKGKNIGTYLTNNCTELSLAQLMIEKDVVNQKFPKAEGNREIVLEVKNVSTSNDRGLKAVNNICFDLRKNEILGIAGVSGNGQSELAELLTGLRPVESGTISLDGIDLTRCNANEYAKAGIGHIPEDKLGMGLVPNETVTHNAILREYHQKPIRKGWIIDNRKAVEFTQRLIQSASVQTPNINARVKYLSGGNQQRLVASREINIASRILIAVHPTQGLDVNATEQVHQLLINYRDSGKSIILISEDLDELFLISDRILVMYEGNSVGVFDDFSNSIDKIGQLMGGFTDEQRISNESTN